MRSKGGLNVRIDKKRFYEGTCKKCKRLEYCQGGSMYSCAGMRLFNSEEFENYTEIKLVKKESRNENI